MAKTSRLALLAFVAALLASAPAGAGAWLLAGSSAGLIGNRDGTAQVDIQYLAPSACHYIASMVQEAPPGAQMPNHALPLTIVVAARSGPCARRATNLRDTKLVHPDLNTNLVRIFFVTPSGKRLKTEQVAINGM